MKSEYTGDEESIELQLICATESNSHFEIRTSRIPLNATPIYDEVTQAIIGYRHECTAGVYRFYDLDGNIVGMEEKPLETPLFDPLDLIFIFGGTLRIFGKGITLRSGTKLMSRAGARLLSLQAATFMGTMRVIFKRLTASSLKFTATTATRMATPGRYVPIHILHLAIKYGKRVADPQGIKGVFQYTIPMIKNGKKYLLEVVVREKDWTILHFLYK